MLPDRLRRGRFLAVAGASIAVTLSACSPSVTARPTVSLLPAPVTGQSSWEWTARCPYASVHDGGCARTAPNLGYAQLSGDEWNLGAGDPEQGSVAMSLGDSGGLDISGGFRSTPPCTQSTCIASSANTWVRGYPSILYGINQCNADTSPPRSATLALPMSLSSIGNLTGTTSYSSRPAGATFDIAYDLWLNRSKATTCRSDGTIEVMVWTDYARRALLPQSLQVGTGSIPFVVNGVVHPGTNAWSMYATNVEQGGQTVPWGGTVWLVLQRSDKVAAGTVSVDLSDALSTVGSLLRRDYGWADFDRNYWLDTVSFGMEYGPRSGSSFASGPTSFSLRLSAYCLDVRVSLSRAAC